jgi:uncharacterized protein YbjT (DUF2867 family)
MEGLGGLLLIHSMSAGEDFTGAMRADAISRRLRGAGVNRIIYLGGLGDPEAELSRHLRSRQQTGEALREGGVPVTEFRASVIVGSGSLSFEMIRDLTERLPVMICPKWMFTCTQPIGIRNVMEYLIAALRTPERAGRIIEIGGADVVTYGEMMMTYADVRGLRRTMIPVPVLTPRLSSYWVHLMTPAPAAVARPLIEGLRNEVVVHDDAARRLFPDITPMDYRAAVELALARIESNTVETAWSDALVSSQGDVPPVVMTTEEGMIREQRQRLVTAPPATVYRAFTGLGGVRGWLYMDWAWRFRGALDRLIGGVGMRRGRRDPDEVRAGEALDFWRVETVEPGRLMRLRAEMKVPGKAWLEFLALHLEGNRTLLIQTAFFEPKGVSGLLYWYGLYPIHAFIFSGMIREVGKRAEALGDSA